MTVNFHLSALYWVHSVISARLIDSNWEYLKFARRRRAERASFSSHYDLKEKT